MATASSYNLNPRSVTIEITDSLKLLRANSLCPQTGSLQGGDHPYGAVEHGQSKKIKGFPFCHFPCSSPECIDIVSGRWTFVNTANTT